MIRSPSPLRRRATRSEGDSFPGRASLTSHGTPSGAMTTRSSPRGVRAVRNPVVAEWRVPEQALVIVTVHGEPVPVRQNQQHVVRR